MTERFGALFLLITGGMILRLSTTGEYLNSVRPGMRLWLTVSAGLLVLVGIIGLVTELRRMLWRPEWSWFSEQDFIAYEASDQPEHRESTGGGESADHGHATTLAAWFLVLPVVVLLAFPTKPLGSFAASRKTSAPPQVQSQSESVAEAPTSVPPSMPPPVEGATQMSILDFLDKTYYDPAKTLAGVPVTVVGFVAPSDRSSDNFLLTRFVIACCAADARPVQIAVTDYNGFVPPVDTWVEVSGTWQPEPEGSTPRLGTDGFALPNFAALRVAPIPPPDNPYATFSY
jgi:uncharacterized repeat protein (TIGR03943 family)